MPASRILRTLDFGVMMSIAYPLRRNEREAVASFIGTKDAEPALPASASCRGGQAMGSSPSAPSWNGWSPDATNARFQTGGFAGLTTSDLGRLTLKWAFAFQGDIMAVAAPTVHDGTLFVGSAGGSVHAIDAGTGCLYWVFQANGPVRSAPVVADDHGARTLVFSDQIGWVYALDARTGSLRWKERVEEHEAVRLTAAAAVNGDIVFVPAASWEETRAIDAQYPCCTFRGSVTALRVRDGSKVWKAYLVGVPSKTGIAASGADTLGPSGAGVWSTPTVDVPRGVLYITTGDNYSYPATTTSDAIVALDLKTGRILWSQQTTLNDVYNSACNIQGANCPRNNGPDHDFGAPAMLVRSTVNGVQGKGGSLDGAGPVIVGGMMFVNSGYPRFGGTPGNVLLAFAVSGSAVGQMGR